MNRLTLAIVVVLCSTAAWAAEPVTITLRAAVRISADLDYVRLADVAVIEGTTAGDLANVVIGPAPRAGEAVEFSVRDIRASLDGAGVHWGRTHLNGRTSIVRAARAPAASSPLPMASIELPDAEPGQGESDARLERSRRHRQYPASELISQRNLRSAIAAFFIENLGVASDSLQLTFDDHDTAFLDTSLDRSRFEIEPVSNLRSGRVDLAIRQWEAERIQERRTISVAPLVREPALQLRRDVARGTALGQDDVEIVERWQAPSQHAGTLLDPSQVVGRITATRLRKGDVLRDSHLQRETVVRRGELVMVRCIVGGAVISIQAEARDNAANGDLIEFRRPGERDTFLATVTGRGSAVVDLSTRN